MSRLNYISFCGGFIRPISNNVSLVVGTQTSFLQSTFGDKTTTFHPSTGDLLESQLQTRMGAPNGIRLANLEAYARVDIKKAPWTFSAGVQQGINDYTEDDVLNSNTYNTFRNFRFRIRRDIVKKQF